MKQPEKERERKSVQDLWKESDRITQDIITHPWKYPLQYLIMRLGRFPDKLEKRKDENKNRSLLERLI